MWISLTLALSATLTRPRRTRISSRFDHERSFANFQRQIDRFGQPPAHVSLNNQPVDDYFDVVPHLTIEAQVVIQ